MAVANTKEIELTPTLILYIYYAILYIIIYEDSRTIANGGDYHGNVSSSNLPITFHLVY